MTPPDITWTSLPDGRLVVFMRNDQIVRSFAAMTVEGAERLIVSVCIGEFGMTTEAAQALAAQAVADHEKPAPSELTLAQAAVRLLTAQNAALRAELAAIRAAMTPAAAEVVA